MQERRILRGAEFRIAIRKEPSLSGSLPKEDNISVPTTQQLVGLGQVEQMIIYDGQFVEMHRGTNP